MHFSDKYELLVTTSAFGSNVYAPGAATNTMQGLATNVQEKGNNSVHTITDSIVTMQMASNTVI